MAVQLDRNNLDRALSPYLRQHADNPVHWQEWSADTLAAARDVDRPLFVSVGYSTCHWCHVMAAEAFSDPDCAAFLNEHFIPVKVDREQRPDIDGFMMSFHMAAYGRGGWPLNVCLSPDLKPFFGATYLPVTPRFGNPGFISTMRRVRDFYLSNRERLTPFEERQVEREPGPAAPLEAWIEAAVASYESAFDAEAGGFGKGSKFPPHGQLLALLELAELPEASSQRASVQRMLSSTLDRMAGGGLRDHLAGGFFRYCVDRNWRIPHFEKMLYDQAQALWVYSRAFRVLGDVRYGEVAAGVYRCLRETFLLDGGLFAAAHDADTDHEEGGTYLWSDAELYELLSESERDLFDSAFDTGSEARLDGRVHLIPRGDAEVPAAIAGRLLETRRARRQPFRDEKVLTDWNCLAGIGLVEFHRAELDRTGTGDDALSAAHRVFDALWDRHWRDGRLVHASLGERVEAAEYLSDYAALTLLATFLLEEVEAGSSEEARLRSALADLAPRLESFRDGGGWLGSRASDFPSTAADNHDHPLPSARSLVELALVRAALAAGTVPPVVSPPTAMVNDAAVLGFLAASGYLPVLTSPSPPDRRGLSSGAIRYPGRQTETCLRGVCTPGLQAASQPV